MRLTFERTQDYGLIKRVITDPRIWPWVTSDYSVKPQDFCPLQGDDLVYLLARDGEELLGLFLFVPQNAVTAEVHNCLFSLWGERARAAAKGAAEWIWANTRCVRLFGNVPECNRRALRFTRHVGMEQFGVNEKSYPKDGRLWDQVMFGMSKPEVVACQQQQ